MCTFGLLQLLLLLLLLLVLLQMVKYAKWSLEMQKWSVCVQSQKPWTSLLFGSNCSVGLLSADFGIFLNVSWFFSFRFVFSASSKYVLQYFARRGKINIVMRCKSAKCCQNRTHFAFYNTLLTTPHSSSASPSNKHVNAMQRNELIANKILKNEPK